MPESDHQEFTAHLGTNHLDPLVVIRVIDTLAFLRIHNSLQLEIYVLKVELKEKQHQQDRTLANSSKLISNKKGRKGSLYIIATPIGNLEDISIRALRILSEVSALACEDTRVTRKLLSRYEIPRPLKLFSCYEHNEERAAKRILALLEAGEDVGLCSSAGMPSLSDPGYRIIYDAISAGISIENIPGPNAATTALVLSGLPTSSYTFLGFLPRKPGPRRRRLSEEAQRPHTLIFYESPYRLGATLEDALTVLGDRRAALGIELTKYHETVERDWLSALVAQYKDASVRGEVTIVIAGNKPKFVRKLEGPNTDE